MLQDIIICLHLYFLFLIAQIRGNIVNGYSSSDGRNLDNHQTGYSILLDKEGNTIIKTNVGLLLAGAFLSTVIPCLVALIMQTLAEMEA